MSKGAVKAKGQLPGPHGGRPLMRAGPCDEGSAQRRSLLAVAGLLVLGFLFWAATSRPGAELAGVQAKAGVLPAGAVEAPGGGVTAADAARAGTDVAASAGGPELPPADAERRKPRLKTVGKKEVTWKDGRKVIKMPRFTIGARRGRPVTEHATVT